MSAADTLPRLAYIGEVPILNISAGPALLYRLLETYPRDRLLIIESAGNPSYPEHELPGVPYARFFLLHQRLLYTRFAELYGAWVFWRAPARQRALVSRLRAFGAEAVLGIAHGVGWRSAAAAAKACRLPFHLIVHDHWRSTLSLPPGLNAHAEQVFGETYRAAATRMPISTDMEAHYRRLYGSGGTVVYPSRSARTQRLERPPLRAPTPGAFVFAYAGSAASQGQRRALTDFANAIAPLGARLRIYQGMALDLLRRDGLQTDNVEIVAFRPAEELHRDLEASADAMYLPMSYADEDRANVELCFPSKLTDYTAVGLPILVRAPVYGTATRWARENPEAAALVTAPDPASIVAAARRLIADAPYRQALAYGALAVGERMFGHRAVFKVFCDCLRQSQIGSAMNHDRLPPTPAGH